MLYVIATSQELSGGGRGYFLFPGPSMENIIFWWCKPNIFIVFDVCPFDINIQRTSSIRATAFPLQVNRSAVKAFGKKEVCWQCHCVD